MEVKIINIHLDEYLITSDKALMHVDQVHSWLSEYSYWAANIPFDVVQTAFLNSFTIGILKGDEQVGYARLITDYAVFAYMADVYVKEEHRGKGLSKAMMQAMLEQDWVQGCRSVMLATRDAHGLYAQYGFGPLNGPERYMSMAPYKGYPKLNS